MALLLEMLCSWTAEGRGDSSPPALLADHRLGPILRSKAFFSLASPSCELSWFWPSSPCPDSLNSAFRIKQSVET